MKKLLLSFTMLFSLTLVFFREAITFDNWGLITNPKKVTNTIAQIVIKCNDHPIPGWINKTV